MNLYSLLNLRNVEQFNRHAPGANFIPMERLVTEQSLGEVSTRMRNMVNAHCACMILTKGGRSA